MKEDMKRKQYHISINEEKIIKEYSAKYEVSEAEIVRMSIREFDKQQKSRTNDLLKMAEAAKGNSDGPIDLSKNHDKYLVAINDDEK